MRSLPFDAIFNLFAVLLNLGLREQKLNYKMVAMEEFQTSYKGFLYFLGYDFRSRSFY